MNDFRAAGRRLLSDVEQAGPGKSANGGTIRIQVREREADHCRLISRDVKRLPNEVGNLNHGAVATLCAGKLCPLAKAPTPTIRMLGL